MNIKLEFACISFLMEIVNEEFDLITGQYRRRDRWTCGVQCRNGQPARTKTSFALHKSMINSRPRYPKVSGRIPRVDLDINVNVNR